MTIHTTPQTRIIFMGTPDFAVPGLRALHERSQAQNWQVVAAVTQPDRPAGRGKRLVASPVKEAALALDIPVLQPQRLRKAPNAVDELRALAPDLLVVAAYGLILPKAVLDLPTFGAINVHASLLPAYRGASPINAAILDGLKETGISIMLMDEGMDTGPVLAQATQRIHRDDTTETLGKRLSEQGAELLVETLPGWLSGDLAPVRQEELPGEPTIVRQIEKEAGRVDWQHSAVHIERMTRAYAPWPSAFTTWRGQTFKIWRATALAETDSADTAEMADLQPGCVVETDAGPAVATGEGLLRLETVQPAGKRAMNIKDFLNGAPDFIGSCLGE